MIITNAKQEENKIMNLLSILLNLIEKEFKCNITEKETKEHKNKCLDGENYTKLERN